MRRPNRFSYPNMKLGGATPPPPVVIKNPELPIQGLETAYGWMTLDKVASFKLAFEWYANNMLGLLFGDPLDVDRQKTYDRATKAKNLGDQGATEGEKFQAWTTALHLYEKVWSKKPLPKIDDALTSTTPPPAVQNVLTVLQNLNTIFQPYVKFRATFNPSREFLQGEILIPYVDLDAFVAEQPLKIALNEVPTVAKVMSLVDDGEGNMNLDGRAFMTNLPLLLSQVGQWATDSSKQVFKPIGKSSISVAPPKVSSTPKVPRTPSANPSVKLSNSQVLHMTGASCRMKGKRADVVDMMVDGMTVGAFKAAVSAKYNTGSGLALAVLKAAIDAGLVTV